MATRLVCSRKRFVPVDAILRRGRSEKGFRVSHMRVGAAQVSPGIPIRPRYKALLLSVINSLRYYSVRANYKIFLSGFTNFHFSKQSRVWLALCVQKLSRER